MQWRWEEEEDGAGSPARDRAAGPGRGLTPEDPQDQGAGTRVE